MLLNGRFIKEEPIKIGVHWAPEYAKRSTPEECFIQDVLLGINPYNTNVIEKFLGKVLAI